MVVCHQVLVSLCIVSRNQAGRIKAFVALMETAKLKYRLTVASIYYKQMDNNNKGNFYECSAWRLFDFCHLLPTLLVSRCTATCSEHF